MPLWILIVVVHPQSPVFQALSLLFSCGTMWCICLCREMGSNSEASPSSFFSQSGSQSNLHNLAGQLNLVGANRGLNIHDMALERSGSGQYDEQKKSKGGANAGFASSSSSGAAAEGSAETFTGQSEPNASNWQLSHQAHHHMHAYSSAQYPTGFSNQVTFISTCSRKSSRILYLVNFAAFELLQDLENKRWDETFELNLLLVCRMKRLGNDSARWSGGSEDILLQALKWEGDEWSRDSWTAWSSSRP